MSSLEQVSCPSCTFSNVSEAEICLMCEKLLHDDVKTLDSPKKKVCSKCSFRNKSFDDVCQVCRTSLSDEHETDDPENVCEACHKELPEWVPVKVCRTCTCHNLDIATICRVCLTPFGPNQHAELVKLCPFCNHDNSDGLDCYNCLYKNVVPTSYCIQCGMPLRDLEDMEVDAPDQSVPRKTHTINKDIELYWPPDCFEELETAPQTHKFFNKTPEPYKSTFLHAWNFNMEVLRSSIPSGVWIKTYEDRLDLMTFMIEGPRETPYENGLFIFDSHLPASFPFRPPEVHYISFWHFRLNPNLYVDGRVCLSLLGTWLSRRKEEEWGPDSTLLQLIVSIQGLVLVEQPFFNEPGFLSFIGTDQGRKRSAEYNQNVIRGMCHATTELLNNPPPVLRGDILLHFARCGGKIFDRLSEQLSDNDSADLGNLRSALEKNCNLKLK